ncbi:hypothetical protein BCR33DRAFT_847843 [Rhizoclosmatium globosum]|uniref:Uncharacterized protein n=1 Tax=Rhizoclosmatium globosum TaxID=329046 RepID=A0A1Y2CN20_9FUNG|nr:hypothetical protein BCR33DRAFT_847843 [Rhizoclosmatium globosum]|eukprot:ORY48429.1 hypothetical protein BCR33DRAFT_847843 [Rhizoclosmatium globosum]
MSSSKDTHNELGYAEQKPKSKVLCGIEWTKKRIISTIAVLVVMLVAIILLVIFVAVPKIAQSSIDGSNLVLANSSITNPTTSSFQIASTGSVSGAGSLAATLNFPDPVTVSWTNRDSAAADLPLGTLALSSINVGSDGTGSVSLNTLFTITSSDNMAKFASHMMHNATFSWRLAGNAQAQAMGLTVNGLSINKVVTLSGFNGLQKVTVLGFDASHGDGDNVNTTVTTDIQNPSQITMEMGQLFFDFSLGTASGSMSAKNITIKQGSNKISMAGVLTPVNGTDINSKVRSLFANAVNNVVPVTVVGNKVITRSGSVAWLDSAFKTLSLNVPMNLTDIAQGSVTGAELSLGSAGINQVQETSFHLTGKGVATNAGFMDASLSFPTPVTVSWSNGGADLVLGTISLSQPIAVSGAYPKSGDVTVDTTFTITSADNMAAFSAAMINSDSFTWTLSGVAAADAYGLSFTNLGFTKQITMAGFSGLKNVAITAFDLPDSDPTNGLHITTTSAIGNPSQITMDMGDVSFNLFGQDMTPIGFLNAAGVTMTPGANSIAMTGAMKVANSTKLSYLMNTFLLSGNGLHTIIVGDHSSIAASWLNSALKQLTLQVTVPSPVLTGPIVSKIQIPTMAVAMNPSDPSGMSVALSAPQITALFALPYPFPVNVMSVQQTLNFIDIKTGVAFATLTTDMGPASADQNSHVLTTAVSGGSLKAISGQEAMFAGFLGALTFVDTAAVNITGSAVSIVGTDAGVAEIALPLTDILPLTGFQGFQDVTVTSTKVVGGDASGVKLEVGIILNNPSTLSLNTNVDVAMDLIVATPVGPLKVGSAIMPNMQIVPGPNVITASAVLAYGADALSQQVLRHIMSGFLAGATLPITIAGTAKSIVYTSLQQAFAKLSIPSKIVGPQNVLLIANSTLIPGSAAAQRPSMNIYRLQNPLNAPLTLASIKAQVTAVTPQGTIVLANIDYTLKKPVTIMPGSFAETEPVPLIQTPQQAGAAGALILGLISQGHFTFPVNTNTTLGAAIGSYPVLVDYQQNNVPVTVYH